MWAGNAGRTRAPSRLSVFSARSTITTSRHCVPLYTKGWGGWGGGEKGVMEGGCEREGGEREGEREREKEREREREREGGRDRERERERERTY